MILLRSAGLRTRLGEEAILNLWAGRIKGGFLWSL